MPPTPPTTPSPPSDRAYRTLSKPPINRRQQFARFAHLALVAPEACEAHGGAEFPGFGLLLTGDCDCTVEIRFDFRRIRFGRHQCDFTDDTPDLGLAPLFFGSFAPSRLCDQVGHIAKPVCALLFGEKNSCGVASFGSHVGRRKQADMAFAPSGCPNGSKRHDARCGASRGRRDIRATPARKNATSLGCPISKFRAGCSKAARTSALRNYCHRDAARHALPVDTSTSHLGFRCVIRAGSKQCPTTPIAISQG